MRQTPPDRILIVRLSALGDVIQTLPVLGWLRELYPQATLGWLVEEEAAVLLEGHPQLDHIHISRRKQWLKRLTNPASWPGLFRETRAFIGEINQMQYTQALDAQGLLKSAILPLLFGIKARTGFFEAREGAAMLYTEQLKTAIPYFDPSAPIYEHFRELVGSLGTVPDTPPSYPLPPTREPVQARLLDKLQPLRQIGKRLVFAPATQWASKHWPVASWAALIQQVLTHTDAQIILIGGQGDRELIRRILSDIQPPADRLLDLSGQTNLLELKALFETADVVVGSDSLPLHLAGAVGQARLIGLYGPTSPVRTPPPAVHGQATLLSTRLDCQPCDQRNCPLKTDACMQQLSPDMVFTALQQAMIECGDSAPNPHS